MNIRQQQLEILESIYGNRLGDAFIQVRALLGAATDDSFQLRYKNIEANYRLVLSYLAQGATDSERPALYLRSARQLLDLTDRLTTHLLMKDPRDALGKRMADWEANPLNDTRTLSESMRQLVADHRLNHMLDEKNARDAISGEIRRERVIENIFNLLWLRPDLEDELVEGVRMLLTGDSVQVQEQALLVSALSLGLLNRFSETRILLLLEALQHADPAIRVRAMIGTIQALHRYQKRLRFYPETRKALRTVLGESMRKEELEIILLQLIRAQDTDEITRKLREEIIPEMMRITPRITERLEVDDLRPEDLHDEENPLWEEFFQDSPELLDKLQEFNEMQMEGMDVYMSAFARLKHFPFFTEVHNWFRPFDIHSRVVTNEMHKVSKEIDIVPFLQGLSSVPFLCNSDKYSFLFNLTQIPGNQLQVLTRYFPAEMDMFRELQQEETLIDHLSAFRNEARVYIQDLYRFHKLNPVAENIPDIFQAYLDLHHTEVFGEYLRESGLLRMMAEFHFKQDHYEQAASMFCEIADSGEPRYEIFEKAAYSYQKLGHYEKALSYYTKAELFDTNILWLSKKMAYCLRQLGRPEEAIRHYQEALKRSEDKQWLSLQLANTYLEARQFSEALNQYYGIELQYGLENRVIRPAAWCLLNLGQAAKAMNYLMQIPSEERGVNDLLNLGHASWLTGSPGKAYESYSLAIKQAGNSLEGFTRSFREDIPLLTDHGINVEETAMMLDILTIPA